MAKYQGDIFNNTKIGNAEADEFFGSWGDDVLVGEGGDDLLDGQEGNDTLSGGSGRDNLRGGTGDDTLLGGSNNDELKGDDGNDTLNGDDGDDRLFGGVGHDTLNGGANNDELNGGDGNDTLNGGTGDDVLYGGLGDDVLRGEANNDTIFALNGADIVDGGSGTDTIHVEGGSSSRFHKIHGGTGSDTIFVDDERVQVFAGDDNDTIHADLDFEQYLTGGNGSDRFVITGIDPFNPSSGRLPYIDGGIAGFTTVDGGLFGGSQTVTQIIRGEDTSVDTLDLSGLGTGMVLDLGTGFLGAVSGQALGGPHFAVQQQATVAGIEKVEGTTFGDTLRGTEATDTFRGDAGDDFLFGNGGDDHLNGGSGSDIIQGGAGKDRILGEFLGDTQTRDFLVGGADADTFVFVNAVKRLEATTVTAPNGQTGTILQEVSVTDRINDFDTTGSDHDFIDLSTLFDLKAPNFTGTAQQAIDQGFIRFLQANNNITQVIFDSNGGSHTDTANNFVIVDLQGVSPADLRADHFLV